ncbi:alpha/beta-hydrolase [Trichoderma longibrachiatum ATCC 18648]|uniref:Carboxylic ester hydrolase n=1 Tax=Trichoderma longibrachiatum ATCC 18648 TaxID=983965 RepID=A0A2T4BV92_TRILO|nr:alpha/beta-hydrolase [Trichoderma longibrachiatum ATCC 18648]
MTASDSPTVAINGCTFVGTFQQESAKYPRALEFFYGIPYATAQRFRAAVPLPPSEDLGVFSASLPAPIQPIPMAQFPTAESPLTLNVFRPSGSASPLRYRVDDPERQVLKNLPVVVYVHGGAFNFGYPLERDLASFMAWSPQPIIAASISYRLGALGFLAGASESQELNLGLKDQRVALEWLREWIGHFGGDPDNITLMGASAGAHSVGHHMLNPSPFPFRKAVLESGSPTARSVLSPLHARTVSQMLQLQAYAMNQPLESLPIDTLVDASFALYAMNHTAVTWPFQPVVDGPNGAIPDLPLNLWRQFVDSGRAKDMSIITGFCSHEGTTFTPQHASTSAEFRSFFQKLIPCLSADDLDALELLYPDPLIHPDSPYRQPPGIGGPQKRSYGAQFRRIHQAYGHYAYICPVLHTAHTLSRAGARVYLYEYAPLSAPFRAASHGDQTSAVTLELNALEATPGLKAMAEEMNYRWTTFCSSPTGTIFRDKDQEAWPVFRSPLGDDGSATAHSGAKIGELLVFGEGNDEAAGGKNFGTPVKTRKLTDEELAQCRFWWDRMELSQGMGERGTASAWIKAR